MDPPCELDLARASGDADYSHRRSWTPDARITPLSLLRGLEVEVDEGNRGCGSDSSHVAATSERPAASQTGTASLSAEEPPPWELTRIHVIDTGTVLGLYGDSTLAQSRLVNDVVQDGLYDVVAALPFSWTGRVVVYYFDDPAVLRSIPDVPGGNIDQLGAITFPVYAELDLPGMELSPGTCFLHDHGYGSRFRDLEYEWAALLLTRVISRPTPTRLTLDLGYKAVASDPPAGNRVLFPALPDAKAVLQNEEHLVLQTSHADRFQPGDELWAIPRRICPTSALHKEVYVVSGGRLIGTWAVASRDRKLTI